MAAIASGTQPFAANGEYYVGAQVLRTGETMRLLLTVLMCVLAATAFAQNGQNEWIEMAAHDLQQSQLTLPGSTPFHLRAEIVETTDPTSKYRGNVEEYWVTPEKWKRIVQSPEFSQTITVNGDKILEKNSGDYFPWWLNNALTAIFTPLPGVDVSSPAGSYAGKSLNTKVTSVCTNTQTTTDRWSFCFDPHRNLLTSAFNLSTDYGAEFKDFAPFGKKQVPRRIVFNPEHAITIEVKITELERLQQPDEQMFAIEQSTPVDERITRVRVSEDTVRKMALTSTVINWPEVETGMVTGGCAVYISVDRTGQIREVWPGGCDNFALELPLRQMVAKWQLKPATSKGVPVQIEARLTFPVATKLKTHTAP
jgi:hypothetical protein